MPSYIEYLQTLSYSTCRQYKSYKNVIRLKKNLLKHATRNGVTLINSPGDNDYQNFISNIIKPKARRAAKYNEIIFRAKRIRLPKIEIEQAPVVGLLITATFVDNALEQCEERPMEQEKQPKQTQEAAPAPVPMVQLEHPMADAAPVPSVQPDQPMAQAQVPMQQEAAISLPHCNNTPIFNGANKPLVLNGLVIEVDPDTFMVNATQMCRAAGRLFGNYRRLDSTEDYLQGLSLDIHICISKLVQRNQSGRGTSQDTNVHFLVALHLAYWLSREVQVQFSKWIGELLLIGRVELGNEMNVQQPMVDTTPVPMIQPEQPMAQAQVPMQEAAISLPHCTNTPIFNGANKPLVLNGLVIEVDPVTLMVNATQMCKAAGKFFAEYHRSKCYKDFQNELSEAMGIPIGELTICENGNRKGTMVHRRIALHLAHRISPVFEVQVTGYLDELFMTGRVELGNEMNVQQLNEKFEQRVKEASKEVQAKASADVKTEQDRCQELELQLATIQEAQQLTKAAQEELMAIKAREDLETTIQALVKNTAPMITSYKDGDNVLYLARIDGTKFKYGHTKNLGQRFETHMRPGVYPTFEPVGIFSCNNGVASEDKVHAYVKKKKIGVDYGTQREIILLDNVDKMQRLIKMMQKCTTFLVSTQPANDNNTDVLLRRIDAETSIELKRIELLMECKITFEQYLQMK